MKEIKKLVCDDLYSKAKNDKKLHSAAKKFKLKWDGSVKSIMIFSIAYVPIEDIKVTISFCLLFRFGINSFHSKKYNMIFFFIIFLFFLLFIDYICPNQSSN